jgi:ribosome-associated protein
MIEITKHISLNPAELKFAFIASPGPGGQNVNKVATAVQLRFDVEHSVSLPEHVRERLKQQLGARLTTAGEVIIKASSYRTQERNKRDAVERLCVLIRHAAIIPKKRKKTKPTKASKERRLNTKKLAGQKKALRRYSSNDY